MNTDIKLFSLISFEVEPINDRPIMFKNNETVNFKVRTLVSPSPSGLLELAKQVKLDGNKIDKFNIFSTVSYIEHGKKTVLKGFYSPTPKQKEGTLGIFEIENQFIINTKLLPNNINQVGGYLEFQQQWEDSETHLYTGNIITTCLPIYERG